MNPIEVLSEFLSDCGHIRYDWREGFVKVPRKIVTGFDVALHASDKHYVLHFGDWHEYLPKNIFGAKAAVYLFKFAISSYCRLKVYTRGRFDARCDLEYKSPQSNAWQKFASQKATFYPFWKNENSHYLQNGFLNQGDATILAFMEDEDFNTAITDMMYDHTYSRYALSYGFTWLIAVLWMTRFNLKNLFLALYAGFPLVAITLLLPMLVMRNWFNDRKYGKGKHLALSKIQKNFLFAWMLGWFLVFAAVWIYFGIEYLLGLFFLLLPIVIVIFAVPVIIALQNKK